MRRSDELPPLGPGGEVVSLSNPEEVANALYRLLSDHHYYEQCGQAMQQRVKAYYQLTDQAKAYKDMYDSLLLPQPDKKGGIPWLVLDLY